MIFERLRAIIAEHFLVSKDTIGLDTSFADDLGADSLDAVELMMAVTDEFDVPEADEETLARLATVGDLARYIAGRVD